VYQSCKQPGYHVLFIDENYVQGEAARLSAQANEQASVIARLEGQLSAQSLSLEELRSSALQQDQSASDQRQQILDLQATISTRYHLGN